MSRVESLNRILHSLQSSSADVQACALISEDGLMIASVLPNDVDETRVAGMTATLSSLGTRAAMELDRGEVQEVCVRGADGYAVMMTSGAGTLLLGLANRQAKLGMIYFEMRRAVEELRRVL